MKKIFFIALAISCINLTSSYSKVTIAKPLNFKLSSNENGTLSYADGNPL